MLVLVGAMNGQPELWLKNRNRPESGSRRLAQVVEPKKWSPGRSHWIVQFAEMPEVEAVARLASMGVEILGYVPNHALLVRADDAQNWLGLNVMRVERLSAADKVSIAFPEAEEGARTVFIVEFHAGVEPGAAREIATREGLLIRNSADLLATHLLVEGTLEQARRAAGWDEVAYVFPASPELINGLPVHGCSGALTIQGPVGNLAAKIGEGWDGPGRNRASLTYSITNLTSKLTPTEVRGEVDRALAEWAKYVDISFLYDAAATSSKHIQVQFAVGDHGDGYTFDGVRGALAHAFYPAPPNPEPVAGDLHLDDEEEWRIGNDTDLYSVLLHEMGHTLGLGHSDNSGAVMYAYYRRVSVLSVEDIAAIRELYAERESTPVIPLPPEVPPLPPLPPVTPPVTPPVPPVIPPVAPVLPTTPPDTPPTLPPVTPPTTPLVDRTAPTLTLTYPGTGSIATTASAISVRGTSNDNVGVLRVVWTSNTSGNGTAVGTKQWVADSIPLLKGTNYIVVRAYDAAGNSTWRSIVVIRR
jgi:hypothetical protein